MKHRFISKVALIMWVEASVTLPARANGDVRSTEEDALVRDFLLGDMTAWKFSSFCFNTTLRGLDAKEIEWRKKLPGPDRRGKEEREYLKDLKSVSIEMEPLPTRRVSAETLDTDAFSVRPAKLEECETAATFRLNRVVTRNGRAFLSGVMVTPCTGVPFGISFRKRGSKWEKQHTAYYYSPMGPPGCGYLSKAAAGETTDSLVILERKLPA